MCDLLTDWDAKSGFQDSDVTKQSRNNNGMVAIELKSDLSYMARLAPLVQKLSWNGLVEFIHSASAFSIISGHSFLKSSHTWTTPKLAKSWLLKTYGAEVSDAVGGREAANWNLWV